MYWTSVRKPVMSRRPAVIPLANLRFREVDAGEIPVRRWCPRSGSDFVTTGERRSPGMREEAGKVDRETGVLLTPNVRGPAVRSGRSPGQKASAETTSPPGPGGDGPPDGGVDGVLDEGDVAVGEEDVDAAGVAGSGRPSSRGCGR